MFIVLMLVAIETRTKKMMLITGLLALDWSWLVKVLSVLIFWMRVAECRFLAM